MNPAPDEDEGNNKGLQPRGVSSQEEKDNELKRQIRSQLNAPPPPPSVNHDGQTQAEKDEEMKRQIRAQLNNTSQIGQRVQGMEQQIFSMPSAPNLPSSQAKRDEELKRFMREQLASSSTAVASLPKSQSQLDEELKQQIRSELNKAPPTVSPSVSQADKDAELKNQIKQEMLSFQDPNAPRSAEDKDEELKQRIRAELEMASSGPSQASLQNDLQPPFVEDPAGFSGDEGRSRQRGTRRSQENSDNELKRQLLQASNRSESNESANSRVSSQDLDLDLAAETAAQGIGDGMNPASIKSQTRNSSDERAAAAGQIVTASQAGGANDANRSSQTKGSPAPLAEGERPGAFHVDARAIGAVPAWGRRTGRNARGSAARQSSSQRVDENLPPELRGSSTSVPPEMNVPPELRSSAATIPPELQAGDVQASIRSDLPPELRPSTTREADVLDAQVAPAEAALEETKQSRSLWKYVALFFIILAAAGVGIGVGVAHGSGGKNAQIQNPIVSSSSPPSSAPTRMMCTNGLDPSLSNLSKNATTQYDDLLKGLVHDLFPDYVAPTEPSCDAINVGLIWLANETTVLPSWSLRNRFILAVFFLSMKGNERKPTSNWMSPVSECKWQGVTCDQTREKIIMLQPTFGTIAATLPSEIGLLTDLSK